MTNGGPKDERNCNPKEKAYCKEYIVDFNKTQAAIRAGYSKTSAKEQGYQLFTKHHIVAYIAELLQERQDKAHVTADYVLSKLIEVVEKSSQARPVMRSGVPLMVLDENGEMRPQYVYDSPGVNKALDLLGKHLGLYTEKIQIGEITETEEEVERKLLALRRKNDKPSE